MRETEIKVRVNLDANNLPEKIQWHAQDASRESFCKSIMLALWDEKENNTLRIDLWTKEMSIEEMKKFYIQNILTLTDTYLKATADEPTAFAVRDFVTEVGKKNGTII